MAVAPDDAGIKGAEEWRRRRLRRHRWNGIEWTSDGTYRSRTSVFLQKSLKLTWILKCIHCPKDFALSHVSSCLLSDKDTFIHKYIEVLNSLESELKYYEHGFIKASTWLKIMKKISLKNHNCIYRESYWGENARKEVSPIKADYKSLLVEYGIENSNCINLLIADKHISRIYMLRRSNFVNSEQWFWDTIIGFIKSLPVLWRWHEFQRKNYWKQLW